MEDVELFRQRFCIGLVKVLADRDDVEKLLMAYPELVGPCMETALRTLLETPDLPPMPHLSTQQLYDYLTVLWYKNDRLRAPLRISIGNKLLKATDIGLLYLIPYLRKIDPSAYIETSPRMLERAVCRADVSTIEYILAHDGETALLTGGAEALSIAARAGNLEIVKLLMTKANDTGVRIPGDNALILASSNRHRRVVKYLLESKADAAADNDRALVNAAATGDVEIIQLLLDAGAGKVRGNVALDNAAGAGNLTVFKLLLNAGIRSDEMLQSAIMNRRRNIIQYLATYGSSRHGI